MRPLGRDQVFILKWKSLTKEIERSLTKEGDQENFKYRGRSREI